MTNHREAQLNLLHRRDSRRNVADAAAVIDGVARCTDGVVKGIDRPAAKLQLEVGGDAVAGLELRVDLLHAVAVQVDKPRGDNQPRALDDPGGLGAEVGLADGRHAAGADADVAHGVEARLRVDHAATGQHEVVHRHLLPPLPAGVGAGG